jgi:hypothetical protein
MFFSHNFGKLLCFLRFELMSSSCASTEVISHVQFTYSSVSIHFVLVGAPLSLHRQTARGIQGKLQCCRASS